MDSLCFKGGRKIEKLMFNIFVSLVNIDIRMLLSENQELRDSFFHTLN